MAAATPRIGELRHRIKLQRNNGTTLDANGQPVEAWGDLHASHPAKIVPLSGSESTLANRMEGRITHQVEIRYFAGLTIEDRVMFGDRIFGIDSIINWEERNQWMFLSCVEQAVTSHG